MVVARSSSPKPSRAMLAGARPVSSAIAKSLTSPSPLTRVLIWPMIDMGITAEYARTPEGSGSSSGTGSTVITTTLNVAMRSSPVGDV